MENFQAIHDSLRQATDEAIQPVKENLFDSLDGIKMRVLIGYEIGVRQGWWEDYTADAPFPFPVEFSLASFGASPTEAHLVHALGLFPSVIQARKNGFTKPLTLGNYTFTKKNIRAKVNY